MRQDPAITLSKIWQTASYGFMAIGLFLLFFLGAQAFAKITDASQVVGKPRQKPSPVDYAMHTVLPFVNSTSVSTVSPAVDAVTQPSDDKQSSKETREHAARGQEVASDKSSKSADQQINNKNSGR